MPFARIHDLCKRLSGTDAGEPMAEVRPAPGKAFSLGWAGPAVALLLLLFLLPSAPALAARQGDRIVNSAWLAVNDAPAATASVTVTVVVRTPSTLEFLKLAGSSGGEVHAVQTTEYSPSGDPGQPFATIATPVSLGSATPIDLAAVALVPGGLFHKGEPIFLRLTDPDQNLDPAAIDSVVVTVSVPQTGDVEVLRLYETGPDTGVFIGYLPTGNGENLSYNGVLAVAEGGDLVARYVDGADGSDVSVSAALVDPFGLVFDSRTGLPVNGVTVTLVDAATGLPAAVVGDDGVSAYPATLISGGAATDAGGNTYTFPPGGYRFPFVLPGAYRLEVAPPAGYLAPSTVSTADLQDLPAAPFAIAFGSRGEVFTVDPGPALRIDIPLDPVSGRLWLVKTAGKDRAAIGDFVPYRLAVENPDPAGTTQGGVELTDRLPRGFRFVPGSARLDDLPLPDPGIGADGRTLTFALDDLGPGELRTISYVAVIKAGAPLGPAVNRAAAAAGEARSNTAEATVLVRDDFFRNTTFLLGRVHTGGCGDPEAGEPDGLAGVRIYLEDGTFVETDQDGMFHFEGVRPGVHAVQLDRDSLPDYYEPVACEANTRFAGRPDSQFVDLQGGTLWRTDFHLRMKPRPRGEVRLEKTIHVDGDDVVFQLPLHIDTVPLENLRLTVLLPAALTFVPGSATLSGAPQPDPEMHGGILAFPLGDLPAGWDGELSFRAAARPAEEASELWTFAFLTFDAPLAQDQQTPRLENVLRLLQEENGAGLQEFVVRPRFATFEAELSKEDRAQLDELAKGMRTHQVLHLFAIGHTDNVRIAPRSRPIYPDNSALSEARARSVAEYLGQRLELPPERVTLYGLGKAAPIADNGTAAGRALNRRVDVRVKAAELGARSRLEEVQPHSGPVTVPVEGFHPGEQKEAEALGLLSPLDGTYLAHPVAAVRVRLESRLKPRLLLDGKEVPTERIGFRMVDRETGKTLISYIGVDFGKPGRHTLTIQGLDPFGNARFEQEATIIRTGEVASIRLLEAGENVADGRTPVTVRLEMRDGQGEVLRTPVELEMREGNLFSPDRKASDVAAGEKKPQRITVDAEGIARFAPVQTGGLYQAVLGYNDAVLKVETYVKPDLRDWILVGLAEGTAGYQTVSGNLENLPPGTEEELYHDGRLAFFGKGQIRGEWLLTLAYDSDKPDRQARELFQVIDPDAFYTLYGDASQQAYDAPSAEKLYVKLERNQFYALFGDFNTELTVTELSRYNRSLTGLKSEYHGKHLAFNLFASDTRQSFVKDEIPGDGTSGLYRLSRRDLVLNSEKVVIEVRDRFRSEQILSSRELRRHGDYQIDYENGTIFFKEAVPSRDEGFNPIFIVVDFETAGQGGPSLNYGGRGAVRWPKLNLEVGVSTIHEEEGAASGDLVGVDGRWELGKGTHLKAEVAGSRAETFADTRDGTAWLAELAHQGDELAGKVYLRELEEGFGLGQQRRSEEGTRRLGADAAWRLTPEWTLGGELFRQVDLETDASRDVAEAQARYAAERYSLSMGMRQATDDFEDGRQGRSTQALFGGTWELHQRLLLRAAHEQSLAGNDASGDYPTRSLVGADFRLTAATTLFAAQEWTHGDEVKTDATRVGLKTTPWTGGQLASSLEQQTGEHGQRMFALFGLKQAWQLSERWSLDGSLDRSQTVRRQGARDLDPDVPLASGATEDFTAVSLGATWRTAKWSWANRIERREADTQEKWGLFSGIAGEAREGLGLSARTQVFFTEGADGRESSDGEIRLGLAYRPRQSRWIVLDRLDYLFERNAGGDVGFNNWRLVNNLNANYKPGRKTQVSLRYGAKYVQENIGGQSYDGFTDLVGAEGRYDLTERWDVGVRGSVLHSWNSGALDYLAGPSVGYNVVKNAWVSLGYNLLGFQDPDFSRADFTAQGPFVKFRFKFDQNSVKELLKQI